ncbi:MAG: pantoate--beta-alanine ligase [Abitibacteriaceae bacterium]|nr:pantoate--beta-alanine ligase [Abditibacteriaceae bacterium]MBV9864400.1 pantoate--beta-alanine ligase [Abditibacteriaceae bacterium]
MQIIETPQQMQALSAEWRCSGQTVGFVPTMGALHEGHLSLVRAARSQCQKVVASVFVNPTQFGPQEDLDQYPRPFEHDCELLREEGCDAIFAPSVAAMYGAAALKHEPHAYESHTFVEVSKLGDVWEGVIRPGHLRGVATVVTKLFNIVRPQRAYFGEKDYQQLKVIECLVRDLNFDIEIVPLPTVREADGLALSSRNAYLAPAERAAATALYQALSQAAAMVQQGERDIAVLGAAMEKICDAQPLVKVQYITIVDAETLAPLDRLEDSPARVLIAAKVGETRLIDNIALSF